MTEVIRSSEMSILTRTTQRHIPEDDILHGHHCENLRSYRISFCTAEDIESNALIVPERLSELYFKEMIHSACLPA
jgi:hypothetical protein